MLKFAVKRKALELFHEAVNNKDINRARTLLEHNRDQFHVDELDDDGLTALQRSCFTGSLKLVQLLVTYGADIGIQDKEGWSVLHAAAVAGNNSILRYLIAMGADIVAANDRGETAIDSAGDLQCVAILAEALAKAGHFKLVENYFTRSPDVKELIEVKLQTNAGSSLALHERRRSTSLKSPSRTPAPISRSQRSHSFTTSRPFIPENDVKMFINSADQYGLPRNEGRFRINESVYAPWSKRCLGSLPECTTVKTENAERICCKCGGKRRSDKTKRFSTASTSSASSDSSSSSDSAYFSNNSKTDSTSCESEATVTEADLTRPRRQARLTTAPGKDRCCVNTAAPQSINPRTALYPHEMARTSSTINRVIQEVDNINKLNASGVSLLHEAASKGDTEAARILLENGAEINRQALNGSNPLHAAVSSGSAQCISLLIEAGADLFAETDSGLLPIDLAADVFLKKRLEVAMSIR